MNEFLGSIFDEMRDVQEKFLRQAEPGIVAVSSQIAECFISGGKLLIMGNGGSASDSQHVAAEFVNRFKMERPPLPAIALTTDTSIITSIGNDYSFDEIFEKQVNALAGEHDVVWGYSTSGNSENVVRGLRAAAKLGATTVGFTGKEGRKMEGLCDILIKVPSETTARIQEMHICASHVICELVDEIMFGRFAR